LRTCSSGGGGSNSLTKLVPLSPEIGEVGIKFPDMTEMLLLY